MRRLESGRGRPASLGPSQRLKYVLVLAHDCAAAHRGPSESRAQTREKFLVTRMTFWP